MSTLSEKPFIHETSKVEDSEVGAWTSIGPNCSIKESQVGDWSYTAGDVQMAYTDIGKFCSIASHVRINPGNHPTWRVMQHHAGYRRVRYQLADTDDDTFFQWRKDHHVSVGHDVWIGHGAIIMPGKNIGNGAVIGSSSVVTKDVEPYTIVVGNPAKPIRRRFSKEIGQQLDQIAWWDWSHEVIKERLNEFEDIHSFIEKYVSEVPAK